MVFPRFSIAGRFQRRSAAQTATPSSRASTTASHELDAQSSVAHTDANVHPPNPTAAAYQPPGVHLPMHIRSSFEAWAAGIPSFNERTIGQSARAGHTALNAAECAAQHPSPTTEADHRLEEHSDATVQPPSPTRVSYLPQVHLPCPPTPTMSATKVWASDIPSFNEHIIRQSAKAGRAALNAAEYVAQKSDRAMEGWEAVLNAIYLEDVSLYLGACTIDGLALTVWYRIDTEVLYALDTADRYVCGGYFYGPLYDLEGKIVKLEWIIAACREGLFDDESQVEP